MSKLPSRLTEKAFLSTLAAGLALVFAGSALAQEAAAPAPAADASAPAAAPQVDVQPQQDSGPIEEIIVTGQRTFYSLIREAGVETENFYARLNEVLDIPDFEITCRNERPTGSNIYQRRCSMRYQEELDSRAAVSAMNILRSGTGMPYDVLPEAIRKMQEFETLVVAAVNSDPQLNTSVVRLMQLKSAVENYESSRQEERRERRAAEEDEANAN
jgi:hypothetical protein